MNSSVTCGYPDWFDIETPIKCKVEIWVDTCKCKGDPGHTMCFAPTEIQEIIVDGKATKRDTWKSMGFDEKTRQDVVDSYLKTHYIDMERGNWTYGEG